MSKLEQFKNIQGAVRKSRPQSGVRGKGATRILLREGLKMENFCDVNLMTYFRWRNL